MCFNMEFVTISIVMGKMLVYPNRPQRSITIEDGEKYSFFYSRRDHRVKMRIVRSFNREIGLALHQE